MKNELYHHGILGQKWGVRRYQNPDGTLTEAGRKHLEREDNKWAKKNAKKITRYSEKAVSSQMKEYSRSLRKEVKKYNANGRLSNTYIFKYNQKQAELMTKAVSGLRSPSGKVVAFVAKRGELGTFMAIADQDYNLNKLRNGLTSSGRIAYKKDVIEQIKED